MCLRTIGIGECQNERWLMRNDLHSILEHSPSSPFLNLSAMCQLIVHAWTARVLPYKYSLQRHKRVILETLDPRLGHPLYLSPISSHHLYHSLIQKPSQQIQEISQKKNQKKLQASQRSNKDRKKRRNRDNNKESEFFSISSAINFLFLFV